LGLRAAAAGLGVRVAGGALVGTRRVFYSACVARVVRVLDAAWQVCLRRLEHIVREASEPLPVLKGVATKLTLLAETSDELMRPLKLPPPPKPPKGKGRASSASSASPAGSPASAEPPLVGCVSSVLCVQTSQLLHTANALHLALASSGRRSPLGSRRDPNGAGASEVGDDDDGALSEEGEKLRRAFVTQRREVRVLRARLPPLARSRRCAWHAHSAASARAVLTLRRSRGAALCAAAAGAVPHVRACAWAAQAAGHRAAAHVPRHGQPCRSARRDRIAWRGRGRGGGRRGRGGGGTRRASQHAR
jgi:hypothetical protein